jgi:non-homologous end joining protein Ku
VNTKYKQGKARKGMAAMAARAICKETVSFGLVNIVPIQVSIARQKANDLDIREVSSGGGS